MGAREQKRLDDVLHKIHLCVLKQEKIESQLTEIYDQRGYKEEDHELLRKAYEAELAKAARELNLAMIIHETYEKEIARRKAKAIKDAEDEAKRLEQERLEEIEREKREKAEKESLALKQRRANKKQLPASQRRRGKSKDMMGMNSPNKKKLNSDGRSTEDLVVSQTKSFAAKIVASAV